QKTGYGSKYYSHNQYSGFKAELAKDQAEIDAINLGELTDTDKAVYSARITKLKNSLTRVGVKLDAEPGRVTKYTHKIQAAVAGKIQSWLGYFGRMLLESAKTA
ncbi:MAG: hypothetical protein KGJ02_08200, partial [Verrucomicrobiota bacterium]|nr:hypothetical protein [Verrucomicrobiota bacterium]